jgi:hypothetical protein
MPEDKTPERSAPDSAQRSSSRESGPNASREGVSTQMSDDELMKIRKAAGAIAEVIEPVQRTRVERTN